MDTSFLAGWSESFLMPETHVITCGISLLTNTVRTIGPSSPIREEKLRALSNPRTLPEALSSLSAREREVLESEMLSLLREDPKKASAELNAFLSYLEEYPTEVKDVHLIVSDTDAGKLTATILDRYLTESGYNVSKYVVKGFGSENFQEALKELRDVVKSVADRSRNVVLNLTGGFKAEIAALSVLATESDLKAYYIHEAARRVVVLPTASQLKVRVTKWEKILAVLTVILSFPMDSLLGAPLFIIPEIAILVSALWIILRKA
ncbi:MAG: putative CRISPR-associated protein [Candidatus Korarchaeota archaeon]|nr:putative CRISPR-associated protein [Candidatus Korarchaeota archaeon]